MGRWRERGRYGGEKKGCEMVEEPHTSYCSNRVAEYCSNMYMYMYYTLYMYTCILVGLKNNGNLCSVLVE